MPLSISKARGLARLRRWFWTIAAIVAGAWGVYQYRGPDYTALKRQGASIIDQIEEYYRVHDSLPESAEAAGIELPHTRWGQWTYEATLRDAGDSRKSTNGESRRVLGGPNLDGDRVAIGQSMDAGYYWLSLSTKGRPRTLWRPYFTLCWWSASPGWRISTSPC